jgi:hypothetical protein
MAHMEFFLVSEEVSVDQQTNRLSLFNVLEQVRNTEFPFVLPSAAAVSLWVAEPGDDTQDFQCILRITLPDGSQHNFTSNFSFRTSRHRVIQKIQGLTINGSGMLRFEVLLNGEYKARHEVDVLRIDPSERLPTATAD